MFTAKHLIVKKCLQIGYTWAETKKKNPWRGVEWTYNDSSEKEKKKQLLYADVSLKSQGRSFLGHKKVLSLGKIIFTP